MSGTKPKTKETKRNSAKSKAPSSASSQEPMTGLSQSAEEIKSMHSYIVGNTFGLKKVEYSAINGKAIFEGDIVLGEVAQMETIRQQVENPDPGLEAAVVLPDLQMRWPNGVIPFAIDAAMPDQQRVTDAINHIHANTNLRLHPRNGDPNFVLFQGGLGCSSAIGMRGGQQIITLGQGCDWPRAVHEICHSAGLWHEQSREDRDHFVTINWANIQPAEAHNFNQHITDGDDVGSYDYDSLMHYGRHDFAINSSLDTITPKPDPNRAIGQRTGLSAGDIAAINLLYPKKSILGDTSTNGPALVARGSQLLLGWTGSGNLRLNFMSSSNGLTFGNKVTLGELSPNALALAVFGGRFYVAWTGVGNNLLNVMQSLDGIHWSGKVTLGDTSLSAPSLAVFNGRLYMAWRGVGNNQLNVISSANGVNWVNKVIMNDTTTSGPSIAVLGNKLLISWRGVGNNQLNVMRSTNGSSFTNKVTLGETTVSKPQLFVNGNRAFMVWQGVGNMFLNVLSSTDGINWVSKIVSRETCIDGPAISSIGNSLVWGWAGTDAAHHLNTLLFNVV